MSFFRDVIIPTPVYPCGGGAPVVSGTTNTAATSVLGAAMSGTVYEYVTNYEAATGKKYVFKTQEERIRYTIEARRVENCVE